MTGAGRRVRAPHVGKRILIGGGIAVLLIVIAFAPVLPASLGCGGHRVRIDCDAATAEARCAVVLDEMRAFGERLGRDRPDLHVDVPGVTDEPVAPNWLRVQVSRFHWFDSRLDAVEIIRHDQDADIGRLTLDRYSSTKRGSSLVGLLMSPTDPAIVRAVDAERDRIEEISRGRTPLAAE